MSTKQAKSNSSNKAKWRRNQRIWIVEIDEKQQKHVYRGIIDRYATHKDIKKNESLTAEHVQIFYSIQPGIPQKLLAWVHENDAVSVFSP